MAHARSELLRVSVSLVNNSIGLQLNERNSFWTEYIFAMLPKIVVYTSQMA
jgi:hypothetical protein